MTLRYDLGELVTAMVTPMNQDGTVNYDKAEELANYLVENEKWVWGYVEMSDWYDYERDKKHYNLEKSIEILKRAESVKDLEDKEAILERLEDAYNKLGNKEKAKEYNRKWNEYINQH